MIAPPVECKCVQRKNRLNKATEQEDVSGIIKLLNENGNGNHCKIIDDDDLYYAYKTIVLSRKEMYINELKTIRGFREDIFQRVELEREIK